MNIIKYLKSCFVRSSTNENINSKQKDHNSITFSVDGFGKQWMYVELVNTDDHSCKEFARLLFDLNEGSYQSSIINLLMSLSHENPELLKPIENILVNWGVLLTQKGFPQSVASDGQTQSKNRPFIRPRNVFLDNNK